MGAHRKLPLEIDALSLLSEALNFDFKYRLAWAPTRRSLPVCNRPPAVSA
jgi:hypothetical protein